MEQQKIDRKKNYTILVYSHTGVVYEKNIFDDFKSDIRQVDLKEFYNNLVLCVNFPNKKRFIKNAKYINPSVNFIGNYFNNHFNLLERNKLDEISPKYYSEFNLRK